MSAVRTATRLLTVLAVIAATLAVGAAPAYAEDTVIGRTVKDRPLRATYVGGLDAATILVVVGQMHGNEQAGPGVVDRLRALPVPDGVGLWLVRTMNPDGAARGSRMNARGVDLNRNFPNGWREDGRSNGARAGSEPETRAVSAFLAQVRPDAVLSFHQPFGVVDTTHPGSRAAARELSRLIGLPTARVGCGGRCTGTLTGWVRDRLDTVAVTVELPARVGPALERRAARAVMRLATWLGQ